MTPQQSKMQTDQDEQQGQGEGQKEAEEKTPPESDEMDVRRFHFVLISRVTNLLDYLYKEIQFSTMGQIL